MSVVVLSHAFGASHRSWAPQVAELGEHHEVIAADLPGHGSAEGAFSVEAAVSSLRQLISAQREPVHLVGISGSVTVALLTALAEPGSVASLTLSGGVAHTTGADAVQRRIMSVLPAGMMVTMLKGMYSGGRPEYEEIAQEDLRRAGKAAVLTGLKDLARVDLRPRLAEVKPRTLVLVGEKDKANVPHARELAAGIADSELRIVPDAGHIWNLEQPEVFTSTLLEFIGRNA